MSQSFNIFKFFEKPKSLKRIKTVLHKKFGAIDRIIKINTNNLEPIHQFNQNLLSFGNVLIFMPKYKILISAILGEVEENESLNFFKCILEGKFSEKPIQIEYFIEGKINKGAYIIILNNTDIKSLFQNFSSKYNHTTETLKKWGLNHHDV